MQEAYLFYPASMTFTVIRYVVTIDLHKLCSRKTLLIYAHHSQWSIGHQRPLTIAHCSGLLWPFQTSWSLAVSALLKCLASNCCEAGLSFSSLCGFQVRAWRVVLDAGFLRVCPIQPHLLLSICLATRSHRSSFRIFSCHRILFWCVFCDIK